MDYFESIDSALAEPQYDRLRRQYARAVIDAVTLTMVVEGEIPDRERVEADKIFEALGERSNLEVDAYVERSLEKARQAAGDDEAVRELCQDIASRLEQRTLQEEAYVLAGQVARIDFDIVSEETEVLQAFVEAFDIPRRRLRKLSGRLSRDV